MSSACFNVEYISENMDQKERSYHCCTDLELAAEIGKNLLERNKELEVMLKSSHQYLEEQSVKNEFLSKQLETLRELHENQARTCEHMEAAAMDLQVKNKELESEASFMKRRHQVLVQTVDNLESKCDDYRTQLEDLQVERMRLQREMANSLSSKLTQKDDRYEIVGSDGEEYNNDNEEKVLGFKKDIEILNDRILKLKRQHSEEKRRREELEFELSDLIHENQQLDKELLDFAAHAKQWQESAASEASNLNQSPENNSAFRRPFSESTDDESYIFVDGDFDRQTSGLSDQSEIEILSPSHELKSPSAENSTSFLSELGSQYHELVRKYDSLVERCRNEGIVQELAPIPTVQRAIQTSPQDERPPGEINAEGSSQPESTTAREYKKLFAQIYSKLEESRSYKSTHEAKK